MINIREISRATNYSISTISKAFSDSTDISDETRKTIIETARKMGYEFKNNRKKSKGKILILTKNVNSSDSEQFAYELVFGFSAAAATAGYSTVVQEYDSKLNYEQIVLSNEYFGGFILGFNQDELKSLGLYESQECAVLLDNFVNNPHIAHIGCDDERGMDLAVTHLHKLGHTRIGMISGPETSYPAQVRRDSFLMAMNRLGLKCPDDLCVYSDFYSNKVIPYVDHFIEAGVTGIVCGSDYIASNIIDYLKTKNLKVPDDISLVGYDNAPFAVKIDPSLTTIDQNGTNIGKAAFTTLMQVKEGVNVSKYLLMPHLIIRNSTGPVKEKHKEESDTTT